MIDYISCLPGKCFGLLAYTPKHVGIRAVAAAAAAAIVRIFRSFMSSSTISHCLETDGI